METELLPALKALSDASRLRVVGLLAGGRRLAVEELAAALELTPGTVVHHLKRLSQAGLVSAHPRPPYVEYELRLDRLNEIGASLGRMGRESASEGAVLPGPDGRPRPAYETNVLRAFISDGRLVRLPAQRKKEIIILRYLAETDFEPDRDYPEKEVNAIFALRHPDVASLRRYMIDHGFMTREHRVYRLRPVSEWPSTEEPRDEAAAAGASLRTEPGSPR
jgi:DNA-binding transcriptional ArsR family regulator